MNQELNDAIAFLIGLATGMFVIWALLLVTGEFNEAKILGSAICEEEYDMAYDTYWQGELSCKPFPNITKKSYDGISINLNEDA